MISRRALVVAFISLGILLGGGRIGWAATPGGLDVMGVRLGLTPEAVQTVLGRQSHRIEQRKGPCVSDVEQSCVLSMTADLPDGRIEVTFRDEWGTHEERVWRIRLTIRARGEQDRDLVREAVVEHYGPPAQEQPAWCQLDDTGRACRADAPSLVFEPLAGAAGQLVLTGPQA